MQMCPIASCPDGAADLEMEHESTTFDLAPAVVVSLAFNFSQWPLTQKFCCGPRSVSPTDQLCQRDICKTVDSIPHTANSKLTDNYQAASQHVSSAQRSFFPLQQHDIERTYVLSQEQNVKGE